MRTQIHTGKHIIIVQQVVAIGKGLTPGSLHDWTKSYGALNPFVILHKPLEAKDKQILCFPFHDSCD